MALLSYIYPQIVNTNIGFVRLRKTVYETTGFTLSMRQLCNRYQLHCKQSNFKEKLGTALKLIKPSEVMAHMIMRSDWLNDGYNVKMNNWFNLLCSESNCGLSLVDQNEKEVRLKSFRNTNAGIYTMMKEMIKDTSLRIDKNQSWKVTKIDNYRRVLNAQYSYNDFMSIAKKYNLAAFDKEMLRHFSTLPLWKWPQLRAYHNKL
jgi:hypothetical protein